MVLLTSKECALQRIQAYDKATGLNSYRLTSPNLSQAAAEKDSELAAVSAANSCTIQTQLRLVCRQWNPPDLYTKDGRRTYFAAARQRTPCA